MVRIATILCPIDFSDCSRHAFDRACAIARSHHGRVVALHVIGAASVHGAVPVRFGPEGPGPFALHAADRDRTLEQLDRFVGAAAAPVPVQLEALEAPSVHAEILDQAERISADLIVMGTHGRSGVERLLLGSVTEKVLRRSAIPVLTVPPRAEERAPAAPFARIVCGVDFSPCSLASLEHAAALARHDRARLAVVHVVELPPVVYEPTIATPFDFARGKPQLEAAARTHLHGFVPARLREGLDVEEIVTSGKAYTEILRVASERDADLVVLGVHGHGVIERLVFGSTATQVVRRAACPVLTVGQAS